MYEFQSIPLKFIYSRCKKRFRNLKWKLTKASDTQENKDHQLIIDSFATIQLLNKTFRCARSFVRSVFAFECKACSTITVNLYYSSQKTRQRVYKEGFHGNK